MGTICTNLSSCNYTLPPEVGAAAILWHYTVQLHSLNGMEAHKNNYFSHSIVKAAKMPLGIKQELGYQSNHTEITYNASLFFLSWLY